jgi:hypothetical protein
MLSTLWDVPMAWVRSSSFAESNRRIHAVPTAGLSANTAQKGDAHPYLFLIVEYRLSANLSMPVILGATIHKICI